MGTPSDDPSVFHEPHLRDAGRVDAACWRCGYPRASIAGGVCPECGAPEFSPGDDAQAPQHAVRDEPTYSPELAGAAPGGGSEFGRWWRERASEASLARSLTVTFVVSLAAGPAAAVAALLSLAGPDAAIAGVTGALGTILWAPVTEELLKTAILAGVIERRPDLFRGRWQILLCAACGGLAFAAIENLLYLRVYIPDPPAWLAAWRWTVCTALHAGCSLIAGLGLARAWSRGWVAGKRPNLADAVPLLVVAMVLHGLYNLGAWLADEGLRAF